MGAYVEVAVGDTGTWQAVACGSYDDLPAATPVAFAGTTTLAQMTANIVALGSAVNVPITTVDSTSIPMTGAGTFGAGGAINSLNMEMGLYAADPAQLNGIWAALISGTFSGATSNSWSTPGLSSTTPPPISDASGHKVTFTGTQWQDGQWQANVAGTTAYNGGTSFTGTAQGAYSDGDGTFNGTGAGTWSSP
jgi:hypothetical protein